MHAVDPLFVRAVRRPSGWICHNRKLLRVGVADLRRRQAAPMPSVAPDRRSIGAITSADERRSALIASRYRAQLRGWRNSRTLADTPATRVLSELGDLQESHLRYIRSLKRAETLLDAILAPCIRAALAEDYAPPIYTTLEPWMEWLADGKRPTVSTADSAPKKRKPRKRRRKLPRKPSAPLCGPHHSDVRHDSLDAARYFVACDYPTRCAQANARRYRLDLAQWRAMAESRDLRQSAPMPTDDDAASVIERHWCDCIDQPDTLPETLPLTRPRRSYCGEPSAPEAIPLAIDGINDADRLSASVLIHGGGEREVARTVFGSENRYARKLARASIARIRARVKNWQPPQDNTPPSYRRAIVADALVHLASE